MSLLGSLLKKTNAPKAAASLPVRPKDVTFSINQSINQSLPVRSKDVTLTAPDSPLIGLKRKNSFSLDVEESDGLKGALDWNGKMTKMVPNPAQSAYIGPNLWDEVLTFGDCATLEVLDTEDFIYETGLLPDNRKKMGQNALTNANPELKADRRKVSAVRPSTSVASASASTSASSATGTTSSVGGVSTDSSVLRSMLIEHEKSPVKSISLDADILQQLLLGGKLPFNMMESSCDSDGAEEIPARSSPPLPVIAAEIHMSDHELQLATVPGDDVFNPKARRFENEELRPLPIMRKAKKQFVAEEQKDDKYWESRRKNNVAAKRARDAQRIKMNQIMVRTAWLEKENEKLTAKLAECLAEQEKLKARLAIHEVK